MYVRRAELLALRNFLDGLSVMIKAFSQLSKAHKMELRAAEAIEARTTKILQKSSPRNKKESRIDTIFSLSPWICAKKFKTFFVVVTLFSENLVVLDDIYKSSSAAGQKILAVSMQDTSAFAIRNSRVHEREGEPPEQEGTHQHSRLDTKEKVQKLKTKTLFQITN